MNDKQQAILDKTGFTKEVFEQMALMQTSKANLASLSAAQHQADKEGYQELSKALRTMSTMEYGDFLYQEFKAWQNATKEVSGNGQA